jgi:SPP1 family predicted phage head-tail adaptor
MAKLDPIVVRPGELRHLVQIQSPVYSADARGQSVTPSNWNLVCSANAAIYTAGGKETSQASQIISAVSHVVKIRWQGVAIMANYQVLFGDRVFTIEYVEDVLERNRVLLLYCLEINQGGGQL